MERRIWWQKESVDLKRRQRCWSTELLISQMEEAERGQQNLHWQHVWSAYYKQSRKPQSNKATTIQGAGLQEAWWSFGKMPPLSLPWVWVTQWEKENIFLHKKSTSLSVSYFRTQEKSSLQNDPATTMFYHLANVLRVMFSVGFPPETVFCVSSQLTKALSSKCLLQLFFRTSDSFLFTLIFLLATFQ